MSKKNKRKKRSRRRKQSSGSVVMVTRKLGTDPQEARTELDVSKEDLDVYMFSHYLLPTTMQVCDYGTMPPTTVFEDALETLAGDDKDPSEVLGAIAVLGHSPCIDALDALRGYMDGEGDYAGVAKVALCECLDMIGMLSGVGDSMAS